MENNAENSSSETSGLREYPEELKARAREFFEKGSEVAYALNYDYAIELYLDGLSFWPENIEEGHNSLREIALRRHAAGGKKSGFGDSSKYKKVSARNPKDAMFKAEYLLSKDPNNPNHMIDMAKGAVDCGFRETAIWIADILFDVNLHQPKPSLSTYIFLRESYSKVECFGRALQACQLALQLKPNDSDLQDSMRDLSAQATMQQGRYDQEDDFRASIKDRQGQEKLQAQERVIRSVAVMDEAIAQARKEYEAEPQVSGKINKLVTELCNTEKEEKENEAIAILEKAYNEQAQFRYKQRSGEIFIKQLTRKVRNLQKQQKQDANNKELAAQRTQAVQNLLITELDHYKLCVENYPTDLRMKYEYGKRLMVAGKYDEAIPVLQEARSDPRHRIDALNYIGRCFFYKHWYADAVEIFEQALAQTENRESNVAKELLYNLARAHEEDGALDEALNCYRRVVQIDFNYLDASKRIDAIRGKQHKNK